MGHSKVSHLSQFLVTSEGFMPTCDYLPQGIFFLTLLQG